MDFILAFVIQDLIGKCIILGCFGSGKNHFVLRSVGTSVSKRIRQLEAISLHFSIQQIRMKYSREYSVCRISE